MATPSTVGEWEALMREMSEADLLKYQAALAALKEWSDFKDAFGWTRIFVLQQSISYELDRRTSI